jgi:hypothetical protein
MKSVFLIIGLIIGFALCSLQRIEPVEIIVQKNANECLAQGGEYHFRRGQDKDYDYEDCEISKTIRY